jgi:hypothetical protein
MAAWYFRFEQSTQQHYYFGNCVFRLLVFIIVKLLAQCSFTIDLHILHYFAFFLKQGD